jgi:hypothetical protein
MDIVDRLKIKSNMIFLGEHIAFGSECELMDEAADEIESLRAQLAEFQKDAERLDYIEAQAKGYGKGWIFRESVQGRGMRLHETGQEGASKTVREAIDKAMDEKG